MQFSEGILAREHEGTARQHVAGTLRVPMAMHAAHRQKLCQARGKFRTLGAATGRLELNLCPDTKTEEQMRVGSAIRVQGIFSQVL